jgi:hypothetical protein
MWFCLVPLLGPRIVHPPVGSQLGWLLLVSLDSFVHSALSLRIGSMHYSSGFFVMVLHWSRWPDILSLFLILCSGPGSIPGLLELVGCSLIGVCWRSCIVVVATLDSASCVGRKVEGSGRSG